LDSYSFVVEHDFNGMTGDKARQISAAGASLSKMPRGKEIERLYDEHAQPLFAFLLNLTRAEADTRDLLQEIFVKLAREPKLLAGVREERAFLIRLAHNAAIDLMRRRGTREQTKDNFAAEIISPFAPTSDPDEAVFRNELADALGELPAEQRTVVHLKLWGGLTFEEIAAALEIPPNTAASRYRYGLDKLRGRLRPLYEEIK
jgi:RNA polymerase sigma-70 factor (ECF subfamily)